MSFLGAELLLQRVTLERPRQTRDRSGGVKAADVFEPVQGYVDVPASVQGFDVRTRLAYGSKASDCSHHVYVARKFPWKVKDRLRDQDGVYYWVLGVIDQAGTGEVWTIEVRRITSADN